MSESDPAKLLKFRNSLWKLHHRLDKKHKHTSLKKLTDDDRYRAQVLASLADNPDEKLAQLVSTIKEQEKLLGINYDLTEEDNEAIAILKQGQPTAAVASTSNEESNKKLPLIIFSVIASAILFYILSQSSAEAPSEQTKPTIVSSSQVPVKEVATNTKPTDEKEVEAKVEDVIPPAGKKELMLSLSGSHVMGEKLAPMLVKGYLENLGAKEISQSSLLGAEKTISAYLPDKGWIQVQIKGHGSTGAFTDLEKGIADVGMSSRKINETEAEQLKAKFGDVTVNKAEHVLALGGITVIVNKSNPVTRLNTEQLAGLFSGEITNWSEVGGTNTPVTIFSRNKQSGAWHKFNTLVLKKHNKAFAANAFSYESSAKVSRRVTEDQGGIGFVSLSSVRNAKAVAIADQVGAHPVKPTHSTIGTEDYPLSHRLYFYTPEPKSDFIKQFVEFSQSNAGQDIVKQSGFISQNIRVLRRTASGETSDLYKWIISNSQRLSVNFRFNVGSNDLDNKSLRDLTRLVEYLADNPNKKISLLGFSDSLGDSAYNVHLSEQRAKKVEEALQLHNIVPVLVKGFGEEMPVSSNNTQLGRHKNRRVEVWVKN